MLEYFDLAKQFYINLNLIDGCKDRKEQACKETGAFLQIFYFLPITHFSNIENTVFGRSVNEKVRKREALSLHQ